jgi:hypothetical protein
MSRGLLTTEQLAQALRGQSMFGGRLGTNLVEMGFVTEDQIAAALSEQLGMPCARPQMVAAIPREVIGYISRDTAERYRVIPLRKDGRELHIGMADPQNLERVDELSFAVGCPLRPYVITEVTLNYALERYYGIRREVRHLKLAGAKGAQAADMRLTTIAETVDRPAAAALAAAPAAAVVVPPEMVSPDADLVERLANVLSEDDYLEAVFTFFARLFPEVALLVPRGEVAQGLVMGNRNEHRPYASTQVAPCTSGSLLHEVISKAQMAYRAELTDPGLLALCRASGMRPDRLAVIPIFENRTPVLIALAQGLEQSQLVSQLERIRVFLAKASTAFQIIALRSQILSG